MTLPIVVEMTVDESQTEYALTVQSNLEEYSMQMDVRIEVAIIPHNYGLITYNGGVITVS